MLTDYLCPIPLGFPRGVFPETQAVVSTSEKQGCASPLAVFIARLKGSVLEFF